MSHGQTAPAARLVDGSSGAPSAALTRCHQPSALTHFDRVAALAAGRTLVVFLDYDGTLTPIVERPDEAFMSDSMRMTVAGLATHVSTAIVTGRAVAKALSFVKLDSLYYAGSHGFDIRSPVGQQLRAVLPEGDSSDTGGGGIRTLLVESLATLGASLASIAGAEVEDNHLCISVHYRAVARDRVDEVEAIVDRYIDSVSNRLQKHHGKKVFELRPKVEWSKGHAVRWLLEHIAARCGMDAEQVSSKLLPVYLGDDVSDESAFAAINKLPASVPVLVAAEPRETSAAFRLRNPSEVQTFLSKLTELATAAGHPVSATAAVAPDEPLTPAAADSVPVGTSDAGAPLSPAGSGRSSASSGSRSGAAAGAGGAGAGAGGDGSQVPPTAASGDSTVVGNSPAAPDTVDDGAHDPDHDPAA